MIENYKRINKDKLGILCLSCGVILVSLHRHDFKACACGNYIDGGDDYVRCGGNFSVMQYVQINPTKEKRDLDETSRKTSKTRSLRNNSKKSTRSSGSTEAQNQRI